MKKYLSNVFHKIIYFLPKPYSINFVDSYKVLSEPFSKSVFNSTRSRCIILLL